MQQAQSGASTAPAAASASRSGSEESIWGTIVWVTVLALTAGVWYLNRSGQEAGAQGAAPVAAGKAASGKAAPAKDSWEFEGRVMDLARNAPIKGAKVSFVDFEISQSYDGTTDDEGHYSVVVPIRWKLGYGVNIAHPLYMSRHWPDSALAAPRKDRLRMGLDVDPSAPSTDVYRGVKKAGSVVFDFALFPQNLTDEERQEASQ